MKTKVYTDGACSGNPGPGGYAAIIFLPESRLKVSGFEEDTTNNRMELTAVITALNSLRLMNITEFEINSDSAYVVDAINNDWLSKWKLNGWKTVAGSHVKNEDLWKELDCVLHSIKKFAARRGMKHHANFIKVKGHSSDEFNKEVDLLAREEIIRNKECKK